ncbi:hypothetical protein [Streptomyces hirsutus]|uniref:hypothetical protein n=1 Tax=Streptomyces hirsutus TaxID=35620 RepID=UPI0033298D20
MRIRTTAVITITALSLTACSSNTSSSDSTKPKASATEQEPAQQQKDDITRASGIPPKPTGEKRQHLLDALAEAAPDVVRYEEKAIDASRNQCSALNGTAVKRTDWLASQRFTYKDVTTTEAQGKAINEALQRTGFCKV